MFTYILDYLHLTSNAYSFLGGLCLLRFTKKYSFNLKEVNRKKFRNVFHIEFSLCTFIPFQQPKQKQRQMAHSKSPNVPSQCGHTNSLHSHPPTQIPRAADTDKLYTAWGWFQVICGLLLGSIGYKSNLTKH